MTRKRSMRELMDPTVLMTLRDAAPDGEGLKDCV